MKLDKRKYVVITGGVISGLGKGVTSASLGMFFSDELKVVPIKLDGYLNVDPGTMNPTEHGEVFVLDDGCEADMDFGHYERFLGVSSSKEQSITMGKVFDFVRQNERRGDYLGKTVQMIPHVTNAILDNILSVGEKQDADMVFIEVGGTVGDMENELYIEAVRQLKQRVGAENICYLHLSYVPIPYGVNEQKTKPTQQSMSLLHSKGIWPDFVLCRMSERLTEKCRAKIALFGNLPVDNVISLVDVDDIYKVPFVIDDQDIVENVCKKLEIDVPHKTKSEIWNTLISAKKDDVVTVTIAGKYVGLEDSYHSVVEALKHSGYNLGCNIKIEWLDTSAKIDYDLLNRSDCVIIPGGFGTRGIEGKIDVIKYVREQKIPFLGICYGLQLAVIENLRNLCNMPNASSLELGCDLKDAAVTILDEQKNVVELGGTMRLGSYDAILNDSQLKEYYNKFGLISNGKVSERHRHRYEVNPAVISKFENKGLKVVGRSCDRDLVEFVEMNNELHPYFVATQAHPELKSKLEKPAPMFYGLVKAGLERQNN